MIRFATLVVLMLAACGATPKAHESLMDSVLTYNEGVRWERFTAAASRLPPKQRAAFVEAADQRAKDLKVTDYEVIRVAPISSTITRVHIRVSWYRQNEGTLHETHVVQSWRRADKAWLLVLQARLRGDAMPGVDEPPTPDAVELDAPRGANNGSNASERSESEVP